MQEKNFLYLCKPYIFLENIKKSEYNHKRLNSDYSIVNGGLYKKEYKHYT